MDGKQLVRLDGLSKLTKIEEIRELLVDQFNVEPERQRLFFSGKQVHSFIVLIRIYRECS